MKSIFDFLALELINLPDDSFIKGETSINKSGVKSTRFRKNLSKKVCDIFDAIEIVVFENSNAKNVILSTPDTTTIKIEHVKMLIDNMFLFYGTDSSHNGKFSSQDQEDIESLWWSGRMWGDLKYEYPSMISMDETGYKLTIYTQ